MHIIVINFKILYVESNLGVLIGLLLNVVYHSLYVVIEIENVIPKSISEAKKSPPSLISKINMEREWPNAPAGPNIKPKIGPSPISGIIKCPAIDKYP